MLKPVKCKNTVDIAIEHIKNHIIQNMKVGDVLPSERDIAEKLQISRNITREALQHFRTLGIIESKPKIGAIITRLIPEDVYAGYKPFLSISPHTFQDLAHLRLTLELGCAERAIKNATDEDIEQLYKLCEKIQSFAGCIDEESKCIVYEADMEFHTKIMELSKNRLINSLIPLVVEFFEQQFRQSAAAPIKSCSRYHEHSQMVDAIKQQNLDQLISLIRSHLNIYLEYYNIS